MEELAHHRAGEVPVRLLDEQRIEELPVVATVGVVVFVQPLAVEASDVGVQLARLAEQVHAEVGERYLLVQLVGMGDPGRQLLGQDQGPVGVAQHEGGEGPGGLIDAGRHRPVTPAGTG